MKADPNQREHMGQNGRAWVEKYHSPQAVAEEFETLLKNAIEESNNGRE